MPWRFASAGRAVHRARRQHARPGRGRQPELGHADPGHRRRPAADPVVARRARAPSSAPPTSPRPSKVAVLGSVVHEQLFGADVDPVGQVIRINNQPFTVVGVMASKGQSGMGQDQDDVVYVPYTTVMKKLRGITYVQNITVSAASAARYRRHGGSHRDGAAHAAPDRGRSERRLHGAHDGGDGQRPRAGHRNHDGAAGEHRRRLAARRRHRHHEHHAGVGDRAHARDRPAPGDRRARPRRPAAVPGRGRRAQPGRRRRSASASAWACREA